MKLFIFGGSFDPPHRGHLEIIKYCCKHSDKLLLIPVANSPLKNKPPVAEGYHRIKMLKLMIQDIDSPIEVDEWEINQSGSCYTFETIQYLIKKYPDSNFSMVMGADQLMKFHRWKNYEGIMSSVQILGFNRDSCDFTPPAEMNITWLKDFKVDISSSNIRKKISMGQSYKNDLPSSIQSYIQKNNLYGCQ